MRISRGLLALSLGLMACGGNGENSVTGPTDLPLSTPPSTRPAFDMLDFMLPDPDLPNFGWTYGTRPPHATFPLGGNHFLVCKSPECTQWETFTYDDEAIYLEFYKSNPANGSEVRYVNGVWAKRFWSPGDTAWAWCDSPQASCPPCEMYEPASEPWRECRDANRASIIEAYTASCQFKRNFPERYYDTFEAFLPDYPLGGDLGVKDVVILDRHVPNNVMGDVVETSMYARGVGRVAFANTKRNGPILSQPVWNIATPIGEFQPTYPQCGGNR